MDNKKQQENESLILPILQRYYRSFKEKTYSEENNDTDVLMDIYGITPTQKRLNMQYWNGKLGRLWESIIIDICCQNCSSFRPGLKIGKDAPCDLILGNDAIDTKYRLGSGDSGTHKKFKKYGQLLIDNEYRPILLILREDNLSAAITACRTGGWTILTGDDAFDYLYEKTGVDVYSLLKNLNRKYPLP